METMPSRVDAMSTPKHEERAAMEIPENVVEDVRRRLHRVAGQVEAIERMLDEGRECRDVVTQISAATKALEQVGFKIVAAGLTYCVQHPDDAAAQGYPLEAVQRMFMKLA
jgi:DNA-binding FrmR family transcriptional regulator